MRTMRFAVPAIFAAAVLHLVPTLVEAQVCASTGAIAGTVRNGDGAPIPRVELSTSRSVAASSDSVGHFRLTGVCAGTGVLRARRIGFKAEELPVDVTAGETLRMEIVLEAVPLDLAPLVIAARPTPMTLRLRDFYNRRQRNAGHFFTREDLEPFDNRQLSDAMRARVPGARIVSNALGSRIRLRSQRCAPMVWLDGMSTPAGEFDIDVLQTSSIAAMEVYSGPATIPAEFRTPFGRDACGGAIVIWTRVGPDQWDVPRARPAARAESEVATALPIYNATEVDEQAQVDSAAIVQPAYPDSLLAFAVEGDVVAEFVVDTTGHPLSGTIRIISTTARSFGESVLRAIQSSRFLPARKDDRPVRQIMTLPFRFTTDPRKE